MTDLPAPSPATSIRVPPTQSISFEVLKARTLATVHDGSPYAQQLVAVTAATFSKLGGKVVAQEAIAPTDVDVHPVLSAIAAAKPDVMYAPVFVAATAQLLRQSKETPGLDHTVMVGGGSVMAPDFIEAAGPSVVGFHICYPDVTRNRWATATQVC